MSDLILLLSYSLLILSGNGSPSQIGAAVRQYNNLSFLSGQHILLMLSQSPSFAHLFTGNFSGNVYEGHFRRIPKISEEEKVFFQSNKHCCFNLKNSTK